MVPPGGPVFGPFILSDVLKLCKLLCAQNVKLEATLTQTASVAGILNCSRPGCQLVVAMMCDADVCGLIPTTRLKRVLNGASNKPPGRHQIQNAEGPVLDPCASKCISEGTQKWTLLGSKVVPPGGPVFGPFILSDVLKLCKLLCAQNVKLEATLTQTASVAGILNWGGPYLRV